MNEINYNKLRDYAKSIFRCDVDSIQGILHCREVEDAVNPIAPQTGTILLSVDYLQSCTIAFRFMTTQNRSTDRVPAHPSAALRDHIPGGTCRLNISFTLFLVIIIVMRSIITLHYQERMIQLFVDRRIFVGLQHGCWLDS